MKTLKGPNESLISEHTNDAIQTIDEPIDLPILLIAQM